MPKSPSFFRVLIAIIRPIFLNKKLPNFYTWLKSMFSQKYREDVCKKFIVNFLACSQILFKSSCGCCYFLVVKINGEPGSSLFFSYLGEWGKAAPLCTHTYFILATDILEYVQGFMLPSGGILHDHSFADDIALYCV